jgi:hypothetical protein
MQPEHPRILHVPYVNPRIQSGASLGRAALDELSLRTGLMCIEQVEV